MLRRNKETAQECVQLLCYFNSGTLWAHGVGGIRKRKVPRRPDKQNNNPVIIPGSFILSSLGINLDFDYLGSFWPTGILEPTSWSISLLRKRSRCF
ncbi:uncharacterized protein [Pleurodeles waltl]|uniref:uncharacterized protein isoform X2 n=1 Tax=Pleurodeles waltl TaxID=8319 RepID=UPI003709AFE4